MGLIEEYCKINALIRDQSPVQVEVEEYDIFDEPFIPFKKESAIYLTPYVLFYSTNLKVKNVTNETLDEKMFLQRQNEKPNLAVFPSYTTNEYFIIARNALSFLPIPIESIKKNTKFDTQRKYEIFTDSIVKIQSKYFYFNSGNTGGTGLLSSFISPMATLVKNQEQIPGIEYCGNSLDAVQKISIRYNLGDRKMPPIEYTKIRESLIGTFNYTDFITGSVSTIGDDCNLVIYTRSRYTQDFVDVTSWSPYIIPFTPTNIVAAATYISIKDMLNDQQGVESRAGFIGYSKDIVTKFVRLKNYKLFNTTIKEDIFFLINSVPVDKNDKYHNYTRFAENYIYNHFDGINTFTPKHTSNLSYLYLDNWSYIQFDRLINGDTFYDDYLNSSPGLLDPDNEVWKEYLEGLIYQSKSNFKIVLFEYWKAPDSFLDRIQEYKGTLTKLLNNREKLRENEYYINQINSPYQPVQLLLENEHDKVPIALYTDIAITNIDLNSLKTKLPKYKPENNEILLHDLIKPGSYTLKLNAEEFNNLFKYKTLILVVTVEDKELYLSAMMPDLLPIKKKAVVENAWFVAFGRFDYKYKDHYYTTNRYLTEKAAEYYNQSIVGYDFDNFKELLEFLETKESKFSLYLYSLDVKVSASFEVDINVEIIEDSDTNTKYNKITINKVNIKQLNGIQYDRKSTEVNLTSIADIQSSYANFITHRDEVKIYDSKVELPTIYSIPEFKIKDFVYNTKPGEKPKLNISLIFGYKKLLCSILNDNDTLTLKIETQELVKPFESALKNLASKFKEENNNDNKKQEADKPKITNLIQIIPLKWVIDKKLESKLF